MSARGRWMWLALSAGLLAVFGRSATAGEGMWLPEQLPDLAEELRALGLEVDPAALADVEQPPLGAIISLGGCSASFVSPDGLVATNHHCAESAIQINSSAESNLFETGFVAPTREEEPWAGPGSRVYVTDTITDVTEEVLGGLTEEMDDRARFETIDQAQKALVAECEAEPGYRCQVAEFYGGGQYRLVRQLELEDVRLVFAPPDSIGDYGGDIDNFMWPRHSGDVALFRAYAGPDGRPATHDAANVPFRPAHHLRVNPGGVSPGELVLVAGYPWSTYRHRTYRELIEWGERITPWEIDLMHRILAVLEPIMEGDAEAGVRLTPYHSGLTNYLKYCQGIVDGLRGSDVLERSAELDRGLRSWLEAQGDAAAGWRAAVAELDEVIEDRYRTRTRDEVVAWIMWSVDLVRGADKLYRLAVEREKPDLERLADYQERNWPRIRESLEGLEHSYVEASDRALLAFFFEEAARLPDDQRIEAIDDLLARHEGAEPSAAAAAANDLYDRTALGDTAQRLTLLEATREDLDDSEDGLIQFAAALYPLRDEMRQASERRDGAFGRLRPEYLEALQAFSPRPLYPDANATLRVTFGTVQGYDGRDAVTYRPFTSLRGIVEKHTGEEPFNAPQVLVDAITGAEYGPYRVDALDSVPVNFLSNVDITGGNSGSATLNARGELVGLVFDGNYEAMPADWMYNPANTRSIHVDVRYFLWLLDRVYEGDHLLREMGVEPAL